MRAGPRQSEPMPRLSSLEEIENLYAERGGRSYGEGVTQLAHALQCAELAQTDDAPPAVVVAALLHDVGHLFAREETALTHDQHHEAVGARALKGLFGAAVVRPVALHVAAKRYLCGKTPDYFEALSPASRRTLVLQGGAFSPSQAAGFERRPGWREAVAVRRYDDGGKRDRPAAVRFADFMPMMRELIAHDADEKSSQQASQ